MATKRMLIDTTHPEETRVVVLSGNRLEELDVESASRKQLKGNIYLAKVTRVEPSLQAAFVDYGGNRHGFLPFDEIHPDYFQIPVADRESLIAEDEREAEDEDDEADASTPAMAAEAEPAATSTAEPGEYAAEAPAPLELPPPFAPPFADLAPEDGATAEGETESSSSTATGETEPAASANGDDAEPAETNGGAEPPRPPRDIETLGGDDAADEASRPRRHISHRHYKIQEVIKRRQILLVQVVKEERGNKGAALTTYLSLAGRYCVLMPNTARGGGISRKIASGADRRRLKSLLSDLELPRGMAVIVRTAGQERSKTEIRRDYEYLMRLWSQVRETTLQSSAPCLVYEEANLIKRAIRDLYVNDIEEILVDGDDGYRAAKDFMKMLIPSHAKKVQPYKEPGMPLFHRFQAESQLDAMHSPVVQLRSGGYIVINPTEALVAIDVNSGRATRERNIEETALRTNQEAAEEIARQLRLRDLAGLIVIDFIDMESSRNQNAVERRLKEAMRHDRARIQIGRISAFGLLEMSRQRLRPSLTETSTEPCPFCQGTGVRRSVESTALYILRAIEEEGIRRRTAELVVHVPTDVALYILNHKRDALAVTEQRYGLSVTLSRDDSLVAPNHRMERIKNRSSQEGDVRPVVPEDAAEEDSSDAEDETRATPERNGEDGSRRRRRRRGRGGRSGRDGEDGRSNDGRGGHPRPAEDDDETAADATDMETADEARPEGEARGDSEQDGDGETRKRRRRGRRGGRRRRREEDGPAEDGSETEAAAEGAEDSSPDGSEDDGAGEDTQSAETETEGEDREDGPRRRRRRRRRGRGGRDRERGPAGEDETSTAEAGVESAEAGVETGEPAGGDSPAHQPDMFAPEPMRHFAPEPMRHFAPEPMRYEPPPMTAEPVLAAPEPPQAAEEPAPSATAEPEPKFEPLPPPPAGVVVKSTDGSLDVVQPEAPKKGWWRRG